MLSPPGPVRYRSPPPEKYAQNLGFVIFLLPILAQKENLMFRTAIHLAIAILLVAPAAALADEAERLEARCAKEMEEADGFLKKVQEGKMSHGDALEEVAEIETLLDNFWWFRGPQESRDNDF